jgi:hypothetical protein
MLCVICKEQKWCLFTITSQIITRLSSFLVPSGSFSDVCTAFEAILGAILFEKITLLENSGPKQGLHAPRDPDAKKEVA